MTVFPTNLYIYRHALRPCSLARSARCGAQKIAFPVSHYRCARARKGLRCSSSLSRPFSPASVPRGEKLERLLSTYTHTDTEVHVYIYACTSRLFTFLFCRYESALYTQGAIQLSTILPSGRGCIRSERLALESIYRSLSSALFPLSLSLLSRRKSSRANSTLPRMCRGYRD